jgi:nitrogen regulatory protein P-II 1
LSDEDGLMKKIEAIIQPYKLAEIKEALAKDGIQGMKVSEVRDLSRQKGRAGLYRGAAYVVDTTPKVRIEVIVEDDEAKAVTDTIVTVLRTGHLCDGEVAVLPVEAVVRIRIGRC